MQTLSRGRRQKGDDADIDSECQLAYNSLCCFRYSRDQPDTRSDTSSIRETSE